MTRAAALGAIAFAVLVPAAPAQAVEAAVRARPAIRLEMLAERVAKLNAQVGQGVLGGRSRRSLEEAIRDFDETLGPVMESAPGAEARDTYRVLTLLWVQYRALALKPANRDTARKFRDRTDELAFIAAKGARLVQESARASSNASAVRAENAAVLAQRVAKIHLWMQWGMRDEVLARSLRESSENLPRILATLRESPANTPEISEELAGAEGQLRFLEDAARDLAQRKSEARAIEFIAKAADHILDSMERVAGLYERAP
ncbi:MAG TPA: hypothetical protein VKR38_13375 [Usitatibacter sp.]|nr:hypothetical protein [Usitatibacter sp.]